MRSWVKRYGWLIQPGRRRHWLGVLLLGLLVSAVEATGAGLVYLLIGLATGTEASIEIPFFGEVATLLPGSDADALVAATAAAVVGFFIVRALIVLLQRYFQTRVVQMAGVDLSTKLLDRYLHLPYAFHLQRNSSKLIRNVKDAVAEILNSIMMPGVILVSEALVVIAIVTILLLTAPLATLLVSCVIAPLVFVVLRVVRPRITELGRVSQREGARSYQALQQGLHGYREITVLGRQEFFVDVFRSSQRTIAGTRYKRAVLSEFPRVTIEAVVIAFIATFVAVSTLAAEDAAGSFAVIGLFGYASLRLMPALNKMVSALNAIRFGKAALEDVEADLRLPLLPDTSPERPLPFREAIRLDGVTFHYEGVEQPTLHDINLLIRQGESVGLVGPTGAGKSTLIDVIIGLSIPSAGAVTVDGIDIQENTAAWHRSIGMVSQAVFLLDDTLRRNIALGVPEEEIDDAQVREAVRLAQLEDFLATLPQGLDTVVGERGARVSGGQRQRVAIARALYPRPNVLVFDEGTAALDNLTEARLIEGLSALRDDHTIITVAHRLTTVQDYDRIVLLDGGRIIDVGSYDELLRRSEDFRRLARHPGVEDLERR